MSRRLSFSDAWDLVRSREEVLDAGVTERELAAAVAHGRLRRVHRGAYVDADVWDELWPEGRQLVRVCAVRRASPGGGPVFSHLSAAALWGLPLVGPIRDDVHTAIRSRRHTRTEAGVVRHQMMLDEGDVVRRHGLRCTSLARTVFDLARLLRPEAVVAAGDAALRMVSVDGHEVDPDAVAAWRAEVEGLCVAGLRGVRRARWIGVFADGRAQLPGESVSRLQLHRLGFRDIDLQVPIVGSDGARYFADFGFPRSRAFGEFDGEDKYRDAELRTMPTAADAVTAEKHREDEIRGVTGWRVVRWGSRHIRTAEDLGRRLAAFGIRPPG
ncbi:type IV toxin-antitoxin system AbiEi family antitoxin domain-containing protein [Microbacterium sp. NPDC077057]|uniref:type IV toxin-antitoxin system AbiEi family antitoxin domain-containing protein n=1 Tax=unclassified Microbacterium TaxID=2609290 RepID=UPI0034485531